MTNHNLGNIFFGKHIKSIKLSILAVVAVIFMMGSISINVVKAASLAPVSSVNGKMVATSTQPAAVANSQVAAAVVGASQVAASDSGGAYGSVWMGALIIVAIIIVIIVTYIVKKKKSGLGYPGLRNADDI